jgi:hypothetical protein
MPIEERHGFVGWKEFHSARREILDEIDQSKRRNVSRPLQTEHGVAGEAKFRAWLSLFLPGKYGVTSGYIIPDVIASDYQLRHFDTIIYDKLNAPVLCADANRDQSEQGARRAIPAKYVRAVFEAKASLTAESAEKAIDKLEELNAFMGHLPSAFTCGAIFFELAPSLIDNRSILPKLLPAQRITGYWGGMVLHCSLDEDMTGLIEVADKQPNDPETDDIPIARTIDELDVRRDGSKLLLTEAGSGATLYDGPDKRWHVSKTYGPMVMGDVFKLKLTWSRNGFANFALGMISRLDGYAPRIDRRNVFGQVYDLIL